MNIKDLVGLKIIDVAEGANSDEWTVTLENKVRLVFEMDFTSYEPVEFAPAITLDIQDYSGGLE